MVKGRKVIVFYGEEDIKLKRLNLRRIKLKKKEDLNDKRSKQKDTKGGGSECNTIVREARISKSYFMESYRKEGNGLNPY